MENKKNKKKLTQQISISSKKKEIKELYDTGKWSLKALGRIYHRSAERIRQILNPVVKLYCSIHCKKYSQICNYCEVMKFYPLFISQLTNKGLKKEIKLFSNQSNRCKSETMKKGYLIAFLIDKKNYSIKQVGQELNRHRTSILNLYKKYAKKNNS